MGVLVGLGLMLAAGLAGARISTALRLPAVTGYLLVGMILGPAVTGLLAAGVLAQFGPFNDFALGLIAFGIGRELDLSYLRRVGSSVLYLAAVQALVPVVLVTATLFLAGLPLAAALLLGGIAAATGPAATIAVMREMRADGPLTRTHVLVVALDDVMAVLAFGVALPLADALRAGSDGRALLHAASAPVLHIAGSMTLGVVAGLALGLTSRRLRGEGDLATSVVALMALATGLAGIWRYSPLLVMLVAGVTVGNQLRPRRGLSRLLDALAPAVLVAFFVMAGASLRPAAVVRVGAIGILYILVRSAGKLLGSMLGGLATGIPPTARRYLGFTLLPQAGVAIGMAVMVRGHFPELGELVHTVVLGAVVVYELTGPPFTRFAVLKAGEAGKGADPLV
ncbi:MAG: cation:proton antiporter [Bacillota bacterium]